MWISTIFIVKLIVRDYENVVNKVVEVVKKVVETIVKIFKWFGRH